MCVCVSVYVTVFTGTVPALPLLVGVVIAMLATTVFVVAQTS